MTERRIEDEAAVMTDMVVRFAASTDLYSIAALNATIERLRHAWRGASEADAIFITAAIKRLQFAIEDAKDEIEHG